MILTYVSLVDSAKQGLSEAVHNIIAALPSIIATLVIIVVGVWVGKLVGSLVTRILSSQGLLKKFNETSIGKALEESGIGLPGLIGGLLYAFIAVISIAIGLQYLNIGATADYYIGLIANYLPRLMAGILILTIGLVFSEIFSAYIGVLFSSMEKENRVVIVFPEIIKIALIVAVIVIGLDVMQLSQFNIIYWIVLGFFIIVLGIYLTDSIFNALEPLSEDLKTVFQLVKIMMYTVFILVGLSAVFSNSPGVQEVLSRIAWGYAIGMGLLMVLLAYKIVKKE